MYLLMYKAVMGTDSVEVLGNMVNDQGWRILQKKLRQIETSFQRRHRRGTHILRILLSLLPIGRQVQCR